MGSPRVERQAKLAFLAKFSEVSDSISSGYRYGSSYSTFVVFVDIDGGSEIVDMMDVDVDDMFLLI